MEVLRCVKWRSVRSRRGLPTYKQAKVEETWPNGSVVLSVEGIHLPRPASLVVAHTNGFHRR